MDMDMAKQAVTAKAEIADRQIALVRRACAMIDESEGERLTLAEIADALDVSPWHLQRLFKRVMGVSPRDYSDARRSAAFRQQLKEGESIAQATYGAGYGSSSRVYERAERLLGMTPASYAKGGKGAEIAFDVVDSPLGRLLVAATAKGLCFLSLGNDDDALVEELRHEFPQAESITRDRHSIAHSVAVVIDYLEGKTPHAELPLDVQATAFQRRVWQELIAIPCGETRTYSEIAESLGVPRGQRAVGRACATNPVSLVIPCHRALREDGGLGGYRWGMERKAALLESEADRPE
ncbi:bifunctional transcriptional activator/DNA repair enzyme AdaA [Pelagibius sp.]|uniref:bifunctional transcriptional activator/DNA repair enzyme AdaA n=1 Tax=Pelagibius sp. TaxID=1931238 RepID=UPI00261FCF6C|nr:methylated-DNA--[protein]-cysteine S-methyltransferase [Pelagibius sp.]